MTPLRQRMIDAMVLRGFSARTQETYLTAVSQLARHHHRSPGLHSISKLLGHAHLSTTARYLRMARPGHGAGDGALALRRVSSYLSPRSCSQRLFIDAFQMRIDDGVTFRIERDDEHWLPVARVA